MNWVTVIWSMMASACLTLAVVHALVWWRRRDVSAHLLFALSATATAMLAGVELWLMQAQSPGEYGTVMRWGHVPMWLLLVSLVGFVRLYLQAGRAWLAWTFIGLRTLALVLNFLVGANFNYRAITAVERIRILGEEVSVAAGVSNPLMLLGNIASFVLLIFILDAGVTVWRRGQRRKAVMVGGSIAFFVLAGATQAALVLWGIVQMPVAISVFYVGIVASMGCELSRELLRGMQLSDDLRESEERLSVTADAANLGLWTWDRARNEIWATEKWRALFGFSKADTLDLNLILQRLHADDREAVRATIAKAWAEGGAYEVEYRVALPNSQTRWLASRGRVESNGDGKPKLMRGVTIDITERRRVEREGQELRQGLAHAGRVTMLGQLASSLAHELSQPLGAILRNTEAAELLLQTKSPDLDELRAIVADIHRDDRRAGQVIDRLRSLLKRRSLESHVLGVDDLVEEVLALVRFDAVARGVKLETRVSADLPRVRGDRVHLLQVVLNLIMNGMDAVEAEPDHERRVTLHARSDGDGMIEVAVRDTGHGVSAETLGRVFDPFFTTKPKGMGMGLPISRTIVEAHGGRIWAESNPDRGTTFRFTLSAAKAGDPA
jgi:PAS domain S-box-containing protein